MIGYKEEVLKQFPNAELNVIHAKTEYYTNIKVNGLHASDFYLKESDAWQDCYEKHCEKETMTKEESKPHSFCETPEEKCTMNYCNENGCTNRKRVLTEQIEPILEIATKGLDYYKKNAEEDYVKVPISVLKYISELEEYIKESVVDTIYQKELDKIDKLTQAQFLTQKQCLILQSFANKLGLCDAGDLLRYKTE